MWRRYMRKRRIGWPANKVKMIGIYIPDTLHVRFKKACENADVSMASILKPYIRAWCDRGSANITGAWDGKE
jgi:hypothetical protein